MSETNFNRRKKFWFCELYWDKRNSALWPRHHAWSHKWPFLKKVFGIWRKVKWTEHIKWGWQVWEAGEKAVFEIRSKNILNYIYNFLECYRLPMIGVKGLWNKILGILPKTGEMKFCFDFIPPRSPRIFRRRLPRPGGKNVIGFFIASFQRSRHQTLF